MEKKTGKRGRKPNQKDPDQWPRIRVYKNGQPNGRLVVSDSDVFLSERLIVKVEEDRLIVRVPTLGYLGKTYKIRRKGGLHWRGLAIINESIPLGMYDADKEESDEDQLVFYYGTQRDYYGTQRD